jgi:hypothetical protein
MLMEGRVEEPLTAPEREAKTHRQIAMVDEQLTREFSDLPADVVHREVASVSKRLLAAARFSDHVAVLTGGAVRRRPLPRPTRFAMIQGRFTGVAPA